MRSPSHPTADAELTLQEREIGSTIARVLLKRTFAINGGKTSLSAPEPLRDDFRDGSLVPRFRPGTEFWPEKRRTDVVVRGLAHSPDGLPTHEMDVSVAIDRKIEKSIRVIGPRVARVRGSRVQFGTPEPFTSMSIGYENAYGGKDERVQPGREVTFGEFVLASAGVDHPGAYPRNPIGKGFVVGSMDGEISLPSLEDPTDLLTPDRLLVKDMSRWHEQPMPWCFEWLSLLTFPRYRFLPGAPDAWFTSPDDNRLAEVSRGFLPSGFAKPGESFPAPEFFQEASLGMCCDFEGGEVIHIRGMVRGGAALSLVLPQREPAFSFSFDGREERVATRTHSVEIRPDEETLTVVSAADFDMQRTIIPGVHKYVDLRVAFSDGEIRYQPPRTDHDTHRVAAFSMSGMGGSGWRDKYSHDLYVDEAEENEYPLVAGIDPPAGLVPLDEIHGPDVELTAFGAELSSTVELLRKTGWLS